MNKLEKNVGAMLEPAWLYADLGEDIKQNPLKILAETVKKYNCRGAVIHLGDDLVKIYYKWGCEKIVAVIDFPYGRGGGHKKKEEALFANYPGVIGLDVVINLWALQNKDWSTIKEDLRAVKKSCPGKEIKVICQMPFIWQYHREIILPLLYVLADYGVNVIKDWTTINNFSKPIKTDIETRVEYTAYLRKMIDKNKLPLLIKVAGEVNKDNVVSFKEAGADIFGISCQKTQGIFETLVKYSKKS